MTPIETIIDLLPIICANYQELKLIDQLNNFFSFDHNLFLLDSSADINCLISANTHAEFTPRSLYAFNSGTDNIAGLLTLEKRRTKNGFMIVVPRGSKFDAIYKLLAQVKEIQRHQINMKIGLFLTHIALSDDLQALFQWCWKHRIINIFAVFHSYDKVTSDESSLNIFTYNPFDVLNVTGSELFDKFFLSQHSNFQQHPLVLGMGKSFDWLSDGYLWLSVFGVLNASFTKMHINSRTPSFNNEIDISPVLHSHIEGIHFNMYPMYINSIVLVVPEALEYSEFTAYLQTITTHGHLGYCILIIAIVTVLLSIFRYIRQAKVLFFESIADVLNLITNDNTTIKYQLLSRGEVCLILPLTLTGLVFVNGLLSNFQSFLTRPIKQPQIDTISDIFNSPFPIFTWSHNQSTELLHILESLSQHEGWSTKIHEVKEIGLLWPQIVNYNTSISFLMELTYAQTLLRVQKRLDIKGYHICETQYSKHAYTYLINDEFPFMERLNEIVHWMRDAGLYDQWWRADDSAFETKLLKENVEQYKSSNIKFPVPMFILYGWFASVIVLAIEIAWKCFREPKYVS